MLKTCEVKLYQELLDETPEEVETFIRLYADLQLKISRIVEQKGITKETLLQVEAMQTQETRKWLKGEHDFSLCCLSKLSVELEEPLLEVPSLKTER